MAFIALNSLGHAVAGWIPCLAAAEALWPLWLYPLKIVTVLIPTVCLNVISLVASSCGYTRGAIEHRVAQSCTAHVATPRGRAERPPHRHPPRAQPVAPLRERHGGCPRLPPRRGTAQAPHREQGLPGGRTREGKRLKRFTCLVLRCPPALPLFAS